MTQDQESVERLGAALRLHHYFALAFACIIGVGWITMTGVWIATAGSLGAVIGLALGGLAMVFIGLCYAEAAAMFPYAGGPYVYVSKALGSWMGAVCGWMIAVGFILTIMFEAISVAWVAEAIWPEIRNTVLYEFEGVGVSLGGVVLSCAISIVLAAFNIAGARSAANFQFVITGGLILISILIIWLGFTQGSFSNLRPYFVNESGASVWRGVFAVFLTAPFFLSGFETVSQGMEERDKAVRLSRIGWVILLAICCGVLFYCAIVIGAAAIVDRATLLQADLAAAEAFSVGLGSEHLTNIVLVAGLLGLVSTWNSAIFVSSRILFAMARRGAIWVGFARTHARRRTPHVAIIFVTAVGGSAVLFGREFLSPLINSASLSIGLVFLLVSLSVLILRVAAPEIERPFRLAGGTVIPLIGVFASLMISFLGFYEPWVQSKGAGPIEAIIVVGWLVAGAFLAMRTHPSKNERRE